MKQIFVFCSFFVINFVAGQNVKTTLRPADLVENAKSEGSFIPYELFKQTSSRNEPVIPSEIKSYSLLELDMTSLDRLLQSPDSRLQLTLPSVERQSLSLELVEVQLLSQDFNLIVAPEMKKVKTSDVGRHYRGIISGDPQSIVAISVFKNQVMGLVSKSDGKGNLVLGKLAESDLFILYEDHQIIDKFQFQCGTPDQGIGYSRAELSDNHSGNRALTDCVRLYLEVDYDIFVNKGSSVSNVNTFVTGIFNQVATLYANENINTVVSEIVVWNTASPYNSTSSIGMLNAFTAYRQGFNGDLAQLLSYKASGGVAYVDGLCRTNPDYSMSYAGIQSGYQNVPVYSWTVEVCTHEYGHLFGSQHTHACVWNGNNTAIDGCYAPEGSCSSPGLPSGGGTIMSYCHLTSAGINFNNGFGVQPGNVMRNKVTNANCLQTCGNNPPPPPPPPPTCSQNQLVLTLKLDNYPSETTWNIKNSTGATLYSGGGYSQANATVTVNLCLATGCFTFNIFDSYGDGICCGYGNGFYNIKQGTTTLISGGQFGSSEVRAFCATGSAPTCTDGIQNGQETGVDCGGPTCPACPTCSDGVKNGQETGVDCGGPTCPACPTCTDGIQNGQETGVDCGGPTCPSCPTCTDGIQNGQETGVDCNGPTCPACPTCTDGIQNGSETGVDCGGTNCPPCSTGNSVTTTTLAGHYFETGWDGWTSGGYDCVRYNGTYSPEGSFSIQLRDDEGELSSMTSPIFNLTPYDSVKIEFRYRAISMETGEDFWLRYFNGTTWVTLKSYVRGTGFNNNTIYTSTVKLSSNLVSNARFRFQNDAGDNTDRIYIDAVVIKGFSSQSSCTDGIQNGQETGVDCGGSTCPSCPTCTDGIQNGQETGVDCGGPGCPACSNCSDGIQNGQETGIDCGGPSCPACPTCSDGTQNGTETGVDCGGANCPPCNSGGSSVQLSGHYFETGWDGWLDGGIDCFRYNGINSPEGNFSIRLRDNEGELSAMTSPVYNLTSFNGVQIQFMFRTVSMEPGEDFWLRYYNGTAWVTVGTFVSGTNFNNNTVYSATVTLTGVFPNNGRFRFQADAGDDTDLVYIDAVVITGTTGSNLPENSIDIVVIAEDVASQDTEQALLSVNIFPNPADQLLNIVASDEISIIRLYNNQGMVLLEKLVSEANHTLDISELIPGLYMIQLEAESGRHIRKFIKK
ncbi:MAG: T9SS type A sorting domain-containing protein [Saprospiraceae bacterium]|nr:T9SS type A sorting domain-containing protein [Saprospiraceae bacterium]